MKPVALTRRRIAFLSVCSCIAFGVRPWAGERAGEAEASRVWTEAMPPPSYSVHRTVEGVRVDGRLDEACWQRAPVLELACDLRTRRSASRGRCWWMAAWSETTLYAAFLCPDAGGVRVLPLRDTARIIHGDAVELFIDPVGDGSLFHEFHANPRGEIANLVVFRDEDEKTGDAAGELGFLRECSLRGAAAAGRILARDGGEAGFVVEMALPLGPEGLGMFAPAGGGAWPAPGAKLRIYPVRVEHPEARGEAKTGPLYVVASPTFSSWNHVPERWVRATFSGEVAPEGREASPDFETWRRLASGGPDRVAGAASVREGSAP